MSRSQVLILTGLGLITALVCLIAAGMLLARVAPQATPAPLPTQAPTPLPSNTPQPTLTSTPRPDTGDEYGAIAICKKFVKDQLIAPRDAKWPGLFDDTSTVTQLDAKTWHVESWVDVSNRLGVHLHTEYSCEVSYQGNDVWRLEALDLQD